MCTSEQANRNYSGSYKAISLKFSRKFERHIIIQINILTSLEDGHNIFAELILLRHRSQIIPPVAP